MGAGAVSKSHFFAGLLITRALQQPGLRVACVREIQRSLDQSVKRLLEDKIDDFGLGSAFRVLRSHIETPGGGVIIFQGMQNHTSESRSSRLEGYDICWVEEAQALSERSLELLRPTIRKDGSELWFSWNPTSPDDPVDALLRADDPLPSCAVVDVGWRDNPWFGGVLRQEMSIRSQPLPGQIRARLGRCLQTTLRGRA